MAEGRAARARGDVQAAIKAFAGADALMHVPTTGIELARTQALAGLLVEARDTALRVARLPRSGAEPGPFQQARDGAVALGSELEGRIPSIRLTVKNIPDGIRPSVRVDDVEAPAELLEQAIRVNPGHHVVVAEALTARAEQEVDLLEADSKDVTIELPPQGRGHSAPSAEGTAREARSTEGHPAAWVNASSLKGSPVVLVSGISVTAAGALTGVITGLVSLSETNGVRSSGQCQNGGTLCSHTEDAALGGARAMATMSNVAFALAGAGAVLGVVGYFVGASPPAPASTPTTASSGPHVRAWLGVGAVGVAGDF
jgi:hypothetical protein